MKPHFWRMAPIYLIGILASTGYGLFQHVTPRSAGIWFLSMAGLTVHGYLAGRKNTDPRLRVYRWSFRLNLFLLFIAMSLLTDTVAKLNRRLTVHLAVYTFKLIFLIFFGLVVYTIIQYLKFRKERKDIYENRYIAIDETRVQPLKKIREGF